LLQHRPIAKWTGYPSVPRLIAGEPTANTPTVLLECHLLRRTGGRRLDDPQHPGCVLVGDRNHDDRGVRRRGACRYPGSAHRSRVRRLGHPHRRHPGSNHSYLPRRIIQVPVANIPEKDTESSCIGSNRRYIHMAIVFPVS